MKKILYSSFVKLLALLLIGVMAVNAAALVVNASSEWYDDEVSFFYGFEESFENSRYFNYLLDKPMHELMSAMYDSTEFYVVSDYSDPIATEYAVLESADSSALSEEELEKELSKLADRVFAKYKNSQEIDYYAEIGGEVYTNCGAKSGEDLSGSFRCVGRYMGGGRMELTYSSGQSRTDRYGKTLPESIEFTIYTAVKEDYVEEFRPIWERQAQCVEELFYNMAYCVIIALLLFIFLAFVWGRSAGEFRELWFDGIWTELYLSAAPLIAFGSVALCFMLLDGLFDSTLPLYICRWGCYAGAALGATLSCLCLLELLRKLKHRRFLSDSICWKLFLWCWSLAKKLLAWCWVLTKKFFSALGALWRELKNVFTGGNQKSGRILLTMLLLYSFALWLFAILTPNSPVFLLPSFALVGFAAFVLLHRAKDLDAIRAALRSIRAGQLETKLPELKSEDLKATARDIEEIAAGMESVLEQRVKAERMKTELITNVSHDLKTPLTSIISYTELLSQVEGLPEEAADYLSVIERKSQRLKLLTEDLFAVSKAQSGSEELNMEKLNAALLIEQALAERESEIAASSLTFCVNTDRELHFSADGRKMSRVLGNLIDNILKYSLSGTRVFISAARQGEEAVMELKNISSYLMDFDAEEICARFVRADEARTDGGSGLGLAIAKSFTELCGGSFKIVTDGDLFKAMISFKAI